MLRLIKWITTNFYILFCGFTLLATIGVQLPLVALLFGILLLYYPFVIIKSTRGKRNLGVIHLIVLGFYILFSFIIYFTSGYPFQIYVRGIFNYVFPVLFFLIAIKCDPQDRDVFYKRTLFALLFTYVVGLYLYFTMPSWYMDWKKNQLEGWLGDRTESYIINYKNLSSFFSHSYFVGYTSFWTLSLLLNKIYTKEKVRITLYVALAITVLVLILAQQRVTFALGFMLIGVYSILELKNKRLRISYFMLFVIIIATIYVSTHFEEITFLLDRYSSVFDGTVLDDGRSNQWKSVYVNFNNYLFGEGFNIVGHEAREYNMSSIADGEFFKTIYELGIFGSLIFYTFCIRIVLRGLRYSEIYAVELPVVIGFVVMQYGADPFGMTNIIILFWYSAGIIFNEKILLNRL